MGQEEDGDSGEVDRKGEGQKKETEKTIMSPACWSF